ncbi:MAG: hypothetical protein K9I34_07495, partial [Bacteroidales bacterium]|nr:hypothetical protein [Bacteroidales bacterium]
MNSNQRYIWLCNSRFFQTIFITLSIILPIISYSQQPINPGLDFVEQDRIKWMQQLDENPEEKYRNFVQGNALLYTNADSALHFLMLAEQQMSSQDSCKEFPIQLYLQLGKAFYILSEYASSFEIN